MVVASLLLILASAAALMFGIWVGNDLLVICSIGLCVFAGVALLIGVARQRRAESFDDEYDLDASYDDAPYRDYETMYHQGDHSVSGPPRGTTYGAAPDPSRSSMDDSTQVIPALKSIGQHNQRVGYSASHEPQVKAEDRSQHYPSRPSHFQGDRQFTSVDAQSSGFDPERTTQLFPGDSSKDTSHVGGDQPNMHGVPQSRSHYGTSAGQQHFSSSSPGQVTPASADVRSNHAPTQMIPATNSAESDDVGTASAAGLPRRPQGAFSEPAHTDSEPWLPPVSPTDPGPRTSWAPPDQSSVAAPEPLPADMTAVMPKTPNADPSVESAPAAYTSVASAPPTNSGAVYGQNLTGQSPASGISAGQPARGSVETAISDEAHVSPASQMAESVDPASAEVDVELEPTVLLHADDTDDDPPDEPASELLLSSEERRLAEMSYEVLVVDGRPRYHLAGCGHLADKANQSLPVGEATELGFTPCSMCSAATSLLMRDL
ncbi:MAG: hypothetical protein HOQ05_04080 [Corynebacteriales bacterium]|nr:hypothetical protein [Mycobacteriales bacterium]